MKEALAVYNSLSGQKEPFKPILPEHVGMYVCGPTVYTAMFIWEIVEPLFLLT